MSEQNDSEIEVIKSEMKCNESDVKTEEDVYSYTKRGEFTSETYKIEIRNLPKHI